MVWIIERCVNVLDGADFQHLLKVGLNDQQLRPE